VGQVRKPLHSALFSPQAASAPVSRSNANNTAAEHQHVAAGRSPDVAVALPSGVGPASTSISVSLARSLGGAASSAPNKAGYFSAEESAELQTKPLWLLSAADRVGQQLRLAWRQALHSPF